MNRVTQICIVKDCGRIKNKHFARGMCQMHYRRWRRSGDAGLGQPHHINHGLSRSPEYNSWANMIERCNNPKNHAYANYGGRGIKVCESWRKFLNFYADMGQRPSIKHTLDRIDVNGDYEPNNCRWADRTIQKHNQRMNIRNSTGYRGVSRVRFTAEIGYQGQSWRIGVFDDPKEAAWMWDQWAIELYGDAALLNFAYE